MKLIMMALMLVSLSTQAQELQQYDDPAAMMAGRSDWVWYPESQTLKLCLKIADTDRALCTRVPEQYKVTKKINGSEIPMY